ncbi:MAG: hypothetical protein BWK73_04800 [Thiothrix lacustris]|uniref:Terminase n=1 Tax=Thiothrix lacustris TaxID=525917 RepID=A0A1Y1QXL7_9GAMM|nr:MAG: hypothetical protein BWK73_04800 [Thiothrix lacustris]
MSIQSHKDKWRRHLAATNPQQAAHQPPVATSRPCDSSDTPLMLASIAIDVQRLHEINSITRKQAVKRDELLPRKLYRDYLANHMTAGKKPGAVMVRMMIWAFDVGDVDYGMQLATYIHGKGVAVMPEGFKRDFPNYILGTVGDYAAAQLTNAQTVTDHICTVTRWLAEHPEWDIVDKIKAAVLKGEGGWLEQNDAKEAALLNYEQAHELDRGVNLRRKIKSLKGDESP